MPTPQFRIESMTHLLSSLQLSLPASGSVWEVNRHLASQLFNTYNPTPNQQLRAADGLYAMYQSGHFYHWI